MEKHLYKFWVVLMALSSIVTLIFTGIVAKSAWKYFSLNDISPAEILEWSVIELSSSRYVLEANYRFEVQGISYTRKGVLESQRFLNRYAAESQIKSLQSKKWRVWYRVQNPKVSSLEREFPRKELFHMLLTLGVAAYFYFSRNLLDVNFASRQSKRAT